MNICIIPARGGSKRIPRKNIREFFGKPMIGWSIECAIRSGCFDRVVVTTDDEEIGAISQAFGAEVPFLRPADLADDYSTTADVLCHAVNELSLPDMAGVCCLYATAPFVTPSDLIDGLEILESESPDFVVSVVEYVYAIQRALKITDGRLEMFDPLQMQVRSQDLEPAYHDAGLFYWGRAGVWRENKGVFSGNVLPLVLPVMSSVDIDTEDDWSRAETLFQLTNAVEERR